MSTEDFGLPAILTRVIFQDGLSGARDDGFAVAGDGKVLAGLLTAGQTSATTPAGRARSVTERPQGASMVTRNSFLPSEDVHLTETIFAVEDRV